MAGRSSVGRDLALRRAICGIWPAVGLAWRAGPGWLCAHVVATSAAAATPVITVWLLRDVIDALAAGRRSGLPLSAVGLLVAGSLAAALPPLNQYLSGQLGRLVKRRAQASLYLATARLLGLARLEDPTFQDRLRMAQQAGLSGPGAVTDGLLGVAQGLIMQVGLLGVLTTINPVVAGITLLGVVPALVAEIRISRIRAAMLLQISPIERREFFYAELMTSISAAKELRLLGLSELFRRRMLSELRTADGHRRRIDARELRAQLGLGLAAATIGGAGLLWAVNAATHGRLGIGDVSAFVAATAAVQAGVTSLVARVAAVHHSLLMYDHYRVVLNESPDLPVPAVPKPPPALRQGIELRDVWFQYSADQPWVLRGVDLVIPSGKAIALVGLNGAGKSTLVKLLCRFYDPQRGAILWDGIDLRDLSVADLRERIGVLFQDYMAYDLSAAENIGLGDVAALDDGERIRAVARRAGVDSILEALPRGYRTMLSRLFADLVDAGEPESGVLLSGGQWQRVALARTFMRDRRDLLILDEPSAGLDAVAEYEIHQELRRHRKAATSVLISHRLSAVRDADSIVVLSDGVVAERGTHAELLAADGAYARLFQLQADGYRDDKSFAGSVEADGAPVVPPRVVPA